MRPLAIVRVAVCTSILGALCFAMMGAVSGDAVYDWVHTLVWCIRSSFGNKREIDADPLLWFDQESGSLPFQKAFG